MQKLKLNRTDPYIHPILHQHHHLQFFILSYHVNIGHVNIVMVIRTLLNMSCNPSLITLLITPH